MRRGNAVDDQSTDDQNVAPAATEQTSPAEITPPETAPAPEPEPAAEGATVEPTTSQEVTGPTVSLHIVSGADRFAYYHGEETSPRYVTTDPTDVDADDVDAVLTAAASVGVQVSYVKPVDTEVSA